MSDSAFYLAATVPIVDAIKLVSSDLTILPLAAMLPACHGSVVAPAPNRWIQYKPVPNNVKAVDWFLECNILSRRKNFVHVFWKVKKRFIKHHLLLEFRFSDNNIDVFFWAAHGSNNSDYFVRGYYDSINPGWHIYHMVQLGFGVRKSRDEPYSLTHARFDISDPNYYGESTSQSHEMCLRMCSIFMSDKSCGTISKAFKRRTPLVVKPNGGMFQPNHYSSLNWYPS